MRRQTPMRSSRTARHGVCKKRSSGLARPRVDLPSMRTSVMSVTGFSRRTLLKSAALGAAGAAFDFGALNRALAAADLTVGIVYVGARDDFGWNQAHAVAIKSLKEVPGVKVVEEENVPETDAVTKTMESMINLDGASLIFATSFGYFDPFMIDAAKKYPKIEFRHPTSLWNKDKHPMNLGGYYAYLDQ